MANKFNLLLILLYPLLVVILTPQKIAWSQNNSPLQTTPPSNFPSVPRGYEPEPFDQGNAQHLNDYRLDFGDSINVSVARFPEFNFSGTLDAQGNVVVPILGRISLKGLTTEEIENKISFELGNRYLREPPQVLAVLTGQRPFNLTVIGEVARPGYYTVSDGIPMSSLLTLAGGTTNRADMRSIIVRRRLTDDTLIEEEVDLYKPLIEGTGEPRIRLQPGDTVVVSALEVGEDQDYDQVFISRTNVPQPLIQVRVVAPTGAAGATLRNINIPNGSTFLDAVALLPEFIPLVTNNEVTLMRFDPELGRVVTQSLNVRQTIEQGDMAQNVPLREDDVIVVSRTLLGRILGGIRIITQPIRDIFGFTNFIQDVFDGNLFDSNNRNNNFRF
ncbi:polysaccharide biosynthesis/export family protein [Cyanobacterium stanieri LEGE 03274]|uniref:Polysaccharide biosynthesis/export family protein n=1 Tax=Cyanobacterium stanieri LEGE 03274 TaxID=1828756 RepID=A0ABR9V1Z9_9CHRO|nr:polysaccharide biosynthesis/export family protein [Cyanobacterium stanieri]MBE9221922.1 polysaccharide biosynthesis/export family protein [Cyanobacterium stanieri LEGE 03274]